jgi:hypothetical protein
MSTTVEEKETRRIQRIALPLPVRVEVHVNAKMSWNEVTRLSDISAFGAGFSLKRPVKRGRLVLLTIPMPKQLRVYDFTDEQYRVWACVRRCLPVSIGSEEKKYVIGVAFIGKTPPSSYIADPSTLYEIAQRESDGLWKLYPTNGDWDDSSGPKDARKQTRLPIPEPVSLEMMDDNGNVAATESTVTENVSLGGASVFTSLNAEPGTFVKVCSDRMNIKIISVVRGKRVGPDGIPRLHLEFIDDFFPLEGIE